MLQKKQVVDYPEVGVISCRQNPNGNMPVVPARLPHIRGEIISILLGLTIIGMETRPPVAILNRPAMLANTERIRGASLICTVMFGNGIRTGTRRLIPPVTRWWILLVRCQVQVEVGVVVPGNMREKSCVQQIDQHTTLLTKIAK